MLHKVSGRVSHRQQEDALYSSNEKGLDLDCIESSYKSVRKKNETPTIKMCKILEYASHKRRYSNSQ